jgi:hypothetical protein
MVWRVYFALLAYFRVMVSVLDRGVFLEEEDDTDFMVGLGFI